MECILKSKAWLYRHFDVRTVEGSFKVEYFGKGIGFECVFVQGEVADLKQTVYWYASHFDFMLGSLSATMEVRIWPWLQIKSIRLTVNGKEIYTERHGKIVEGWHCKA